MTEISCNHTLILRTRNRPSWLAASLEGYLKFDYQGELFIVDDSEDEALSINQETINKFKNSTLKIRHLTGLSKGIEFRHERVVNSMRKSYDFVETDFMTFTSDDDFFFPTFIEPAISFLNGKPDYSAVVGPEIMLWADEELRVESLEPRWWPVYESDDPLERFANYCYTQSIPYYGVFRSDFIRLIKQVEAKTGKQFTTGSSINGSILWGEEIQNNGILVSSGKIGELTYNPMNMRIWHKSSTRIEMKKFIMNSTPTPNSHGFFVEMLDDSYPSTLRHWVEEACTWMMLCGTKYSEDQVYDTVLRWNQKMLSQFQGAGPLYSPDAFSKSVREQKSKLEPTKKFLVKTESLIWAVLKLLLTLRTRSLSVFNSHLKTLGPMLFLRQRSILKSREVSDYMDHFNSLDKGVLAKE